MSTATSEADHKSSRTFVICSNEPLSLLDGIEFVSSPKTGAINTFSGTVRDTDIRHDQQLGKQLIPIKALNYEAYEPMVRRQLLDIIDEVLKDSNHAYGFDENSRAYVAIRLGIVPVGESSLIICVSSTGRHFSHWATMSILEKIKSSAAIWKKIIFSDGMEEWSDCSRSEAFWLPRKGSENLG